MITAGVGVVGPVACMGLGRQAFRAMVCAVSWLDRGQSWGLPLPLSVVVWVCVAGGRQSQKERARARMEAVIARTGELEAHLLSPILAQLEWWAYLEQHRAWRRWSGRSGSGV